MKKGVTEYARAVQNHEDGFHGNPPEGCISRTVFRGYEDRNAAMDAMTRQETHCPQCGRKMRAGRWISQEGRRYMSMAACPEHGRYLVRVRMNKDSDGTLRVSRLVYEGASDAARRFDELMAEKKKKSPARRRRRRRAGKETQNES